MTLKSRLTIIMASLFFLFIFLFTTAFSLIFWQHAKKVEQARLETKLLNMSDYIGKHYGNRDLVRTYGHKFFLLSNTLNDEVWIVDKNSLHLAGSKNYPKLAYDQLPPACAKDIQQVLAGNHINSSNFSLFTSNLPLTVGVPITNTDNQIIGALLIHYRLPNFFDSWYDSLGIAIFTAIILYLLMLYIAYRVFRRYTMPLAVYDAYIQKLIKGDYKARLKLSNSTDYNLLAQDLNTLAKYLAKVEENSMEDKLHTKTLLLNSAYANYETTNSFEALLEDMYPYLAKYLPKSMRHKLLKLQQDLSFSTADLFREQAPQLLGFNFMPLNFLDNLRDALNKFQLKFKLKEITIKEINPPMEGFVPLQGDPQRVEQMLSIIIRQIIAALEQGEELQISYDQDPSRYLITLEAPSFKKHNHLLSNNLHYLVARNLAHLQNMELRYEQQNTKPCYRIIIPKNIKFS